MYPEVSLVVDVDGKRDDEADAIDDQKMEHHVLSNMVLSINKLLNTFLQVKFWCILSLLQNVSQKEIRNGVDQLGVIVKFSKVMGSFKFVGLTAHHFVDFDLSYEGLEVDVIVLDLTLLLLNINKLLLSRLILQFSFQFFGIWNNLFLNLFLDIIDVLKACKDAENLFICAQKWKFWAF